MAITRGKTNPKKEKEDSKVASTSKKIQKAPKDTKAKKTTKTTKSKSQSPTKKAAPEKEEKKEKKAAMPMSVKGYTDEQYARYKDLLVELNSKTNEQLKAMLSRNGQVTTGKKKELVERCADGQTLGRIPSCPRCIGGRPKFDFQSGIYECPGYYGAHFQICIQKYTLEELPRKEWRECI